MNREMTVSGWLRIFVIFTLGLRTTYSAYCSTRIVKIANGDYSFRSGNSVVLFKCNPGFTLLGAPQIVCFGSTWSNDPPICIANTCPKIHESPTLRIKEFYNGAMLKFSCTVMHQLEGTDKLVCDGTNWSDDPPVCKVWDPPRVCDFENVLLCGWTHHDEDDQDWRWQVGATKTTRTGPNHDHTLGANGNGHYMYFESSSPTRKGHEAWFSSPLYPISYSGDYCFQFWYHSFGSGVIGEMKVFVKPELTNLTDVQPVFYLNSSLGEEWRMEMIPITKQVQPFQIVFTAKRGDSYRSDFAIDDVLLQKCDDFTTKPISTQAPTTVATAQASSSPRTITTTVNMQTNATMVSSSVKLTTPTKNLPSTKKPSTAQVTQSSMTKEVTSKLLTKTTIAVPKRTTMRNTKTTKTKNLISSTKKRLITSLNTIKPTVESKRPTQEKSIGPTDGPSSAVLAVSISLAVVLCVAIALGVGFYLYRRNKRKYTWSKDSSFASDNPLYRVVAGDESAVSFANLEDN